MFTRLTTCILASLFSCSIAAKTFEFRPFTAVYNNKIDAAVNLSGEAIQHLVKSNDGSWTLSLHASASVAEINESSQFLVTDNQVLPLHYQYHRKIMFNTREAELLFDWDAAQVTNNVDNKPWSMPIHVGVHDRLSYQYQMAKDLALGKTELSYQVADGGRLKEYAFRVVGEEMIETEAGQFNSIKIERLHSNPEKRQTAIWIAPELNFAVAQIIQNDKGNEYWLSLKSINFQ